MFSEFGVSVPLHDNPWYGSVPDASVPPPPVPLLVPIFVCRFGVPMFTEFDVSVPLHDNHVGGRLSPRTDCLHFCHPGVPEVRGASETVFVSVLWGGGGCMVAGALCVHDNHVGGRLSPRTDCLHYCHLGVPEVRGCHSWGVGIMPVINAACMLYLAWHTHQTAFVRVVAALLNISSLYGCPFKTSLSRCSPVPAISPPPPHTHTRTSFWSHGWACGPYMMQ
jgi:hypothetical protein